MRTLRPIALSLSILLMAAAEGAEGSSVRCTMLPFEAQDGRTGKCCVVWDEPSKQQQPGVATSAPHYLPPAGPITTLKEAAPPAPSSTESTASTRVTKKGDGLRKKVIDTPQPCAPGQIIDVNGDCVDNFGDS